MINPFEALLQELSSLIGIDLHVDNHGACCVQIKDSMKVQVEMDKKNNIVLFAFLGEVGPGKFREEILKEGLKANAQLLPGGIIGFSGLNNQLSCHRLLDHEMPRAQEILDALTIFIDYALQWQTSLQEEKTAPGFLASAPSTPPPFGIKL